MTPRVNVLEIQASEEIHLQTNQILERRRQVTAGFVIRVYVVDDITTWLEEIRFISALRPESPLDLVGWIDSILGAGQHEAVMRWEDRNLVVLAEPTTQAKISRFLSDLQADLRTKEVRDSRG